MVRVKRQHIPKKQIDYEHLSPNTIQLNTIINLLATEVDVPIDSTGIKHNCGLIKVTSEMVKHLKEAYFEAYASTPSATDASVDVELYNATDGEVITALTFAGVGGYKESSDIASTLKTLAGKIVSVRINVKTASATSGATQTFRSAHLRLVLGIS